METERDLFSPELIESIESRAAMLAYRYYFLDKEDLMQNGYVLLLHLANKNLPIKQQFKAINNYFSNVDRNSNTRQKVEVGELIYDDDNSPIYEPKSNPPDIQEQMQILQKHFQSLTTREKLLIVWLDSGFKLKDIAEALGIEKRSLRRLYKNITDKKGKIENAN